MDKILSQILNDKTSGSAELLDKLIQYLTKSLKNGKSITNDVKLAEKYLGHFAIVEFHLNKISLLIKKNDRDAVLSYLSSLSKIQNSIYQKIFTSIPPQFMQNNKVLTLSNSKTVYEVLKQWSHYNKKLEVIVLESQPKCEGKVLADKLKKAGIKVNVVLDSEMSRYIEKFDLILLGCDLIFKDGSVLNKTGSRDAAIIAWYFNKPVLIVSSKTKHSNCKKINIEGRDRSESMLFERVEKELITHLVTD